MKASQVKMLLGWILAVSVLNLVVVTVVMINLGSVKMKVEKLNGGSSNSSQLSALQSSVDALSNKIGNTQQTPVPAVSSTMTTCSGSLNQNLSGSSSSIGSFTNLSLSGTSPINLTCTKL